HGARASRPGAVQTNSASFIPYTHARLFACLEHIHCDGHVAAFVCLQRADPDDLARDFLAAIVANRYDDGILPSRIGLGLAKIALDAQRGEGRLRTPLSDRLGVEAQVVLALRAHTCAFEDRRLAVWARARPADRRAPTGAHEPVLPPFSSQPNSARPRMREP